jgi:excisionase family DNA binding protein
MDNIEYNNMDMEFLTRKEVAKYFRVSERTIDRWIVNRSLKGYKLGKGKTALWRIPKSEIKKFLDRSLSK